MDDETTDDMGINIVKCGMPKAVTTNKSVMVLEIPTLCVLNMFFLISFRVVRRFTRFLKLLIGISNL